MSPFKTLDDRIAIIKLLAASNIDDATLGVATIAILNLSCSTRTAYGVRRPTPPARISKPTRSASRSRRSR